METVENLKGKQRAHAEIAKRLEEAEADMNKLSEKEKIIQEIEKDKIIQEQASLIKEKEMAAEMFEEKEQSHADMAKSLEESEATSTRSAKKSE